MKKSELKQMIKEELNPTKNEITVKDIADFVARNGEGGALQRLVYDGIKSGKLSYGVFWDYQGITQEDIWGSLNDAVGIDVELDTDD